MSAPVLTAAERDYVGSMSYLVYLCELEKVTPRANYADWINLPADIQAFFRKAAIAGLNAYREERRIEHPLAFKIMNVEVERRVKQLDRAEANETQWQRIQNGALAEQIRVLIEATERADKLQAKRPEGAAA